MEGLRTELVHVVFIPVSRSQLIPWLTRGLGDIAAGNLTITENHQMLVDFSEPIYRNTEELVVTGPVSPPINVIEDLAVKEVFIQSSSSYRQSLETISQTFIEKGLAPIEIRPLDEVLEVDGILEMVQAGLIPIENIGAAVHPQTTVPALEALDHPHPDLQGSNNSGSLRLTHPMHGAYRS